MAEQEVWRLVDGMAIRCTDCRYNERSVLYADGMPIGVEYTCTAPDEICDFLKKKIDSQKAYSSSEEAYADIPVNEEGT